MSCIHVLCTVSLPSVTVYISLMTEVRSPKQRRISLPFKFLVRDELKH